MPFCPCKRREDTALFHPRGCRDRLLEATLASHLSIVAGTSFKFAPVGRFMALPSAPYCPGHLIAAAVPVPLAELLIYSLLFPNN